MICVYVGEGLGALSGLTHTHTQTHTHKSAKSQRWLQSWRLQSESGRSLYFNALQVPVEELSRVLKQPDCFQSQEVQIAGVVHGREQQIRSTITWRWERVQHVTQQQGLGQTLIKNRTALTRPLRESWVLLYLTGWYYQWMLWSLCVCVCRGVTVSTLSIVCCIQWIKKWLLFFYKKIFLISR